MKGSGAFSAPGFCDACSCQRSIPICACRVANVAGAPPLRDTVVHDRHLRTQRGIERRHVRVVVAVVRNQERGHRPEQVLRAGEPGQRVAAQIAEIEKAERAEPEHHSHRTVVLGAVLDEVFDRPARGVLLAGAAERLRQQRVHRR